MADEKQKKAALKEGGKKGQDLAGMADFGIKFFHVAMDTPKGDWDLLELCMDGACKEVDETADDRKGGAGNLGKCFLSAGEKSLIVLIHAPEELEEQLPLKEWMEYLMAQVGGKVLGEPKDRRIRGEVEADVRSAPSHRTGPVLLNAHACNVKYTHSLLACLAR